MLAYTQHAHNKQVPVVGAITTWAIRILVFVLQIAVVI